MKKIFITFLLGTFLMNGAAYGEEGGKGRSSMKCVDKYGEPWSPGQEGFETCMEGVEAGESTKFSPADAGGKTGKGKSGQKGSKSTQIGGSPGQRGGSASLRGGEGGKAGKAGRGGEGDEGGKGEEGGKGGKGGKGGHMPGSEEGSSPGGHK